MLALGLLASLTFSAVWKPSGPEEGSALQIALTSPYIKELLSREHRTYTVTNDTYFERTGYIGYNVSLTELLFMMYDDRYRGGGPGTDYVVAFVDIKNKTVPYSVYYIRMPPPYNVNATIPSGAYWYFNNPGDWASGPDFQYLHTYLDMNTTPKSAKLYPILLNESNFKKLKEGKPFEAIRYFDFGQNRSMMYDGSVPVSSQWHAEADQYREYSTKLSEMPAWEVEGVRTYLVLYNPPDNPDIQIDLWIH